MWGIGQLDVSLHNWGIDLHALWKCDPCLHKHCKLGSLLEYCRGGITAYAMGRLKLGPMDVEESGEG